MGNNMYTEEKLKNEDVAKTYTPASFGNRVIAHIIDGFIIGLVGGIVVAASGRGESFALSTLVGFFYYWYFWTQRDGQTPGKSIVNIRVIKANGAPMTAGDSVLRFVGYWISGLFFGLGYLWALWDSESQAWHDKIAGTYVVETEPRKKKKIVTG